MFYMINICGIKLSNYIVILLLLPLALQSAVGFGLSNSTSPFVPIYHHLSPSSHSQHLKISFHFFCPIFPGSSSSSRPFQFLSENLFGHPILLHSLQVTQPTYTLPLYPFYYILSFDLVYRCLKTCFEWCFFVYDFEGILCKGMHDFNCRFQICMLFVGRVIVHTVSHMLSPSSCTG